MITTLNLKTPPDHSVDARLIAPQNLCGLDKSQIENLPIGHNSTEIRIGDFFDVNCHEPTSPCGMECNSSAVCPTASLILTGDLSSFHRIGQTMNSGRLWIIGNVGSEFASRMSGGICVVAGHTSDNAGQGLRGGLLAICGHCGNDLASPLPGKKTGMTGGDILIGGNVGDRAAHRMRRGTILVSGHAGHYGCQQMIAGTVIAQGNIGDSWCLGMKRGSLIELNPAGAQHSTHAGFTIGRDFELSFLQILWKHLRTQHKQLSALAHDLEVAFPFALPKFPQSNWVTRQVGDTLVNGQGEWLRVITSDQS
ncbi:MAG: formylmethanofuran dehydrogenase subunit C [Pirellula sp.]